MKKIAKKLGFAICCFAQFAFADGPVSFDFESEALKIPTVHIGLDQYVVEMKQRAGGFDFSVTSAELISKLEFSDGGNLVGTKTLTELADLLPVKEMEVYDPTENRNKTFRGFTTNDVLDLVYGESWRDGEEIAVAALDGYVSSNSIEHYLMYNSMLAFEDVNRPQFILIKAKDGKYIELGPFFLVWDNINSPELLDFVSYGWPWQSISFDLLTFEDRFGKAIPPEGSSEQVQRGFKSTRKFCLACHTMNGDGGWLSGTDLFGTADKFDDATIKRYITEFGAVGPDVSGMILRDEIPNRDQVADDIIAYLNAMAKD